MKKYLILVIAIVSLTACAGVRANTDPVVKPQWDGDVVAVDAFSKDNWFSFSILPSIVGGIGFHLNGGGVGFNLFPVNVNGDFTNDNSTK